VTRRTAVPLLAVLGLLLVPTDLRAQNVAVGGTIVDPSGLPLPGVIVTLRVEGGASINTSTDVDGRFHFDAGVGKYSLAAELNGFERETREVLVIDMPVVVDLMLRLAKVEEQVSVGVARQAVTGESRAGAAAVVTREIIDNAMLPNTSVFDVLPLLPNVVRGPDGLISVAGARAPQGQLLLTGLSQNDPVLGEAALMLPLVPVDSVHVLSRGYSTEFGRATGGVTQIEMRSPSDTFTFNAQSFAPRPHFAGGGLRGIEAFEPNFGMSGPLVRGRLWLTEAFDYRWERYSFDTKAGREESRHNAVLSWTAVDALVSDAHRVVGWLSLDPQDTDHASLSAFTPIAAVPSTRQGGWRAAIVDRFVAGAHSSVESAVEVGRLRTEVTPAGTQQYVMDHDLFEGNYFNAQQRTATRLELAEKLTRVIASGAGGHTLTVGGHIAHVGFQGTDASAPVEQRRSDGLLARRIEFLGTPVISADGAEASAFIQDAWSVGRAVTLDIGVRYDAAMVAPDWRLSPRVGATWKIDDRTTVNGGVGGYADKVLLATAAFPRLQSRTVTEFDADLSRPSAVYTYRNELDGRLRMPSATAWHLQWDRRVNRDVTARVVYQEQHGSGEPVIGVDNTPERAALVLRSDGVSRTRSLETTVGYRASRTGDSVYLSYVRASSVGNLNDFVSLAGVIKEPFVQADEVGPLPASVPHRLLAWGLLKLPSRITVAPFVEVRNGFPYSPIDDDWRYVGPRNSEHFPLFVSFDVFVNKVFKLPGRLPSARIGLKCFNLTGAQDARDVQRDLARVDYRTFYNPLLRQIRGSFELMWGEK
jgi:hypothetical protein